MSAESDAARVRRKQQRGKRIVASLVHWTRSHADLKTISRQNTSVLEAVAVN
jgi:hypothetical protein